MAVTMHIMASPIGTPPEASSASTWRHVKKTVKPSRPTAVSVRENFMAGCTAAPHGGGVLQGSPPVAALLQWVP